MRAKRSKKYRKVMQQYELAFGFREPYQVLGMSYSRPLPGLSLAGSLFAKALFLFFFSLLVDSHFLRAVHSFRMDLIPSLERTLQGKAKPCKPIIQIQPLAP